MFIELTDLLRCTADHAESYLVLLPGRMEGRQVVTGDLGCPVCGRVVRLVDGVADFGGGIPSDGRTTLSAEALAAFLGISGPGGYVALLGGVTSLAEELGKLLPDVGLALINPAADRASGLAAGVLRAGRCPLKQSCLRGAVLGADAARDPAWVTQAAGSVLPGLRVVGESGTPPAGLELLGQTGQCWVGKR
ncbi:MAG TPA: hypothetical protein VL241_03410 [Gemmatimonadales bacterium]|nr:hypothetical protein [Gemmatimonadales bacterium]